MPALIIQKNEDGSVLMATAPDMTPEQQQTAQVVASLDDAAQAVKDVLGDDTQQGEGDPMQQQDGAAGALDAGEDGGGSTGLQSGTQNGQPQDPGAPGGAGRTGPAAVNHAPPARDGRPGEVAAGSGKADAAMEQGFKRVRGGR